MEQLPSLHDKAGLEQAGFSSGSGERRGERFLHLMALLHCQEGDKRREKKSTCFLLNLCCFYNSERANF